MGEDFHTESNGGHNIRGHGLHGKRAQVNMPCKLFAKFGIYRCWLHFVDDGSLPTVVQANADHLGFLSLQAKPVCERIKQTHAQALFIMT